MTNSRPPFEDSLQGDTPFEPGQWGTKAVMDAVTERDVLSIGSVEHELVRFRKCFGIAVGGCEYQEQGVGRPDGLIADINVLTGARLNTVSTKPCNPSPVAFTGASSAELKVLISRPKGSRKSSHHRLSWAPRPPRATHRAAARERRSASVRRGAQQDRVSQGAHRASGW